MKTYIALLRGINVSGQKKVPMAELKACLEELSYRNVRTYIQSGNVVFQKADASRTQLEKQIEDQLLARFGFQVPTLVKEPPELEYVLNHNPFLREGKDPDRLYLTFLADTPAAERVALLDEVDYSPEAFVLDGKNIFFFSPSGYGRAKMNNNFFEQKLKVDATTRNWRTVNRLWEMAGEE